MKRTLHMFLLLLAVDLIGSGMLWFGYIQLTDMKKKETEFVSQLHEEGLKGLKLQELRKTLVGVGKQREELDKYLIDPREENQITLIATLEGLGASTTGAKIETSSFALVDGSPKSIHGEFSFSGTWEQLFHVLRLFEEYPSATAISRFDENHTGEQSLAPGKPPIDKWTGNIGFDLVSLKRIQN